MSDEEEDIFTLTPLQRCRSQSNNSLSESRTERKPSRLSLSQNTSHYKNKGSSFKVPNSTSVSKSKKSVVQSNSKAPKPGSSKRKTSEVKLVAGSSQMGKKVKQEGDIACPLCQMPWHIYDSMDKSHELHTNKCLDRDISGKPECEKGIECSAILEFHYWNFCHSSLAKERAEQERIYSSLSRSQIDGGPKNSKEKNIIPNSDLMCQQTSAIHEVSLISDDESDTNSKASSVKSINLFSFSQDNEGSGKKTSPAAPSKSKAGDSRSPNKQEIEGFAVNNSTSKDDNPGKYSDEDFFGNSVPDIDKTPEQGFAEWDKETIIFSRNNSPHKCTNFGEKRLSLESNQATYVEVSRTDTVENSETTFSMSSTPSESLLQPMPSINDVEERGEGHNFLGNDKLAMPMILNSPEDWRQKDIRLSTGDDVALQEPVIPGTSKSPEDLKLNEERSKTCIENNKGDVSVDLEIDSDENDIFSNLVEQAMEKYLGDSEKVEKTQEKRLKPESEAATEKKKGVRCRNQGSCKPCIHLHFHLQGSQKSPKKGGQTSILNFFQAKGSNKSPEAEPENKCSLCCKCACKESPEKLGGKGAASSWKDLMSRMQRNSEKSDSTNSSSSTQLQEDKPDYQQRKCPFYKYIKDTDVVVDAFCYGVLDGVKAYFLTHFHYDHYRGLTKKFNQPIYCSEITGRLVNLRLGVPLQYLHFLPMEEPRVVCGLEVTLLEANHCPGAVMFLFKLRTGATVLHVGDFRAHPKMESYPALWNCSIDTLYLDTTYCNAVYDFPRQEDVIEKCVSVATSHVADNAKTLIVVGSYSIGKERVFKAIASALDCKIWASSDKQRTLRCIQDKEICSRLTSEKLCARVHVLAMSDLQPRKLMAYVETLKPRYSVVVSIRPTGWEHSSEQGQGLENLTSKQCGNVYMYGIPYSEHSSFNELRRFVQFVQPKRIIPTVNVGNQNSRRQMEKYFQEWLENAQQKDIGSFLQKKL
ncbi:DNA cross-link repair 1A protein-like isoform X2 [Penaeus japonicus]|uniref:DNA cross-link repair 1A protein-like isoform X2 n=1 Tax=Penaeus japonicus TaxID=27405 RepID=UPI001C70C342|nr:DNA cross-link repair 1A protein-like isoform X2 [Penaeus japonicus]